VVREVKEVGQEKIMRDKEVFSNSDFSRCVQFHGHTCPGLAIGFQAAITLLKRLGVRKAPDEGLVAVVETFAESQQRWISCRRGIARSCVFPA